MDKPTRSEINKKIFNYGIVVLLILLGYMWTSKNETPNSSKELGAMEQMTAPPQIRAKE